VGNRRPARWVNRAKKRGGEYAKVPFEDGIEGS